MSAKKPGFYILSRKLYKLRRKTYNLRREMYNLRRKTKNSPFGVVFLLLRCGSSLCKEKCLLRHGTFRRIVLWNQKRTVAIAEETKVVVEGEVVDVAPMVVADEG